MRILDIRDRILGRGDAAVTVPPMDGAFRPNSVLDTAEEVTRLSSPDNLLRTDGNTLCSSGHDVLVVENSGATSLFRSYPEVITCMTAMPDGRLAVGLDDGRITIDGSDDIVALCDEPAACPTALLATDERTILVAIGSRTQRSSNWQRDLLQGGKSGSVWRFDVDTGEATRLGSRLAYPNGLALADNGTSVVVSESWRHRLVRLDVTVERAATPVLSHLPGYPSRLSPDGGGGNWLTLFAPRSQLIEFVLREPAYRKRMLAEIEPDFWVAPSLISGQSFKEPQQGGAIKSMGILKPWAPTRSYGLVVHLNSRFQPERSFHSRADGKWHGITSVLQDGDRLLLACKGGDAILALELEKYR